MAEPTGKPAKKKSKALIHNNNKNNNNSRCNHNGGRGGRGGRGGGRASNRGGRGGGDRGWTKPEPTNYTTMEMNSTNDETEVYGYDDIDFKTIGENLTARILGRPGEHTDETAYTPRC